MEMESERKIVAELGQELQAVIVCGLPGTGKSTLAQELRKKLGALHLDTDRLRKSWAYLPDYSSQESEKNYCLLRNIGEKFLEQGRKVIFDGTFLLREGREEFYRMFEELGVDFAVVYVQARRVDVKLRLKPRKRNLRNPNDFSDADWLVYKAMEERLEEGDFSEPSQDEVEELFNYCTEGWRAKPATFLEVLDGIELALFSVDCWGKYGTYFRKICEYLDCIPSSPKKSIICKEKPTSKEGTWSSFVILDGKNKESVIKKQIRSLEVPSNKCLVIADNRAALDIAAQWRISRISLSTLLSVIGDYPEPKNLKDPSRP